MEFLDEDDRQGAIRAGRRAVAGAALAFASALLGSLFGVLVHPLVGAITAGGALVLAGSGLRVLLHTQARVIGGLRVVGLVVAALALLFGGLVLIQCVLLHIALLRNASP